MRLTTAVLMISLALCSGVDAQQSSPSKETKMYKWVDENGTVHYSSTPADAAAAQEVAIRKGPAGPAVGPVAPVADPEEVRRCDQLRKNLALLESPTGDLEISENGKLRPLTAAEREPQLKATRAALESCAAVPAPPN